MCVCIYIYPLMNKLNEYLPYIQRSWYVSIKSRQNESKGRESLSLLASYFRFLNLSTYAFDCPDDIYKSDHKVMLLFAVAAKVNAAPSLKAP